METPIEIEQKIRNLGYDPSKDLVATVQELHLRDIPEKTIRKGFLLLQKRRKEEAQKAKDAAKAGSGGQPAAPAAT